MKRRDFIKRGLLAAGGTVFGAALSGPTKAALPASAAVLEQVPHQPGGLYVNNRAPLTPLAFIKLPIGAIKAKGWLGKQLDLEVNGLTGKYTEVSDYLKYDGNGWVDPTSDSGWEEVTYWLRGFTPLGYVSGDADTIALANKWLTGIIASQRPDGWFGPNKARTSLDGTPDMWPHMPVLYALRSYQEATNDPKVIPFLTNYFKFQNAQPASAFGKSWAGVRWGDNIDSIYWLYNRTGDAFLLDLVTKIHQNSADWTGGIASYHNVNFAQGFREPAQYGVLANDPKYLTATEANYKKMFDQYGQMAGGAFAGDENCRPRFTDPRQGLETCGIAEFMLSFEILTRITGNPLWCDRAEEIAFNMLPAAYDPLRRSIHYITSLNSIQLDNEPKTHKQFDDSPQPLHAYMPGVHNYRCCPHNAGMSWPMYTENLWHATPDNGLAANLYAPSTVTAKVGDGSPVTIDQVTDYPFGDTVKLSVTSAAPVQFPMYLRIPRWTASATVRVNGQPQAVTARPLSYVVLNRKWKTGDVVELHLPMHVSVRTWVANKNSVSIDRGPLTYSLLFDEQWKKFDGTDQWPLFDVYPQSPWNYGLVLDSANPAQSFDVVQKSGALPDNPFTTDAAPIQLRAKARKIDGWTADTENVVTTLLPSPVRSSEKVETVTLIPMGAARLRITSFPTIGDGPDAREWVVPVELRKQASWVSDDLDAMDDTSEPASSFDNNGLRFTWWDHKGTAEWVEYDLPIAKTVTGVAVYWFDDTGHGACRVPQSWQVQYKDGDDWKPVDGASGYGVALDRYNRVTFAPVTTTALRLAVQLQPGVSGGVLRWRLATADKSPQKV
jgi:hypothetical protein